MMTIEEHKKVCKAVKEVHMRYLCQKTLQKTEICIDQITENRATEDLKDIVKTRNEKPLDDFILAFINRSKNPAVTQAMAHLLLLFMGDATISAVVPFNYHYHILETCAAIRNDIDIGKRLYEMTKYGVELSDVLHASKLHGFWNETISFVEYLVDQSIQVHHGDRPVQVPHEIQGSYNPESGTVYYFTLHGNQIRKQPHYLIDQAKKNYDNVPSVDDLCNKVSQCIIWWIWIHFFYGSAQFMDTVMGFNL